MNDTTVDAVANGGQQPGAVTAEAPAFEWAIVEIFGHRRHAGRIREEERFGAKMLRIDVPVEGKADGRYETLWYGGSSIFSLALTDEPSVMRLNQRGDAPGRYSLPAPQEQHDRHGAFDDPDEGDF